MLVTQDMGVIAEAADRVAVMYAGRLAEIGPVAEVIGRPRHPYTAGLMGATPGASKGQVRLTQIPGAMPRLDAMPPGCAFHPRCPRRGPGCDTDPPLTRAPEARAACHYPLPAEEAARACRISPPPHWCASGT